MTRNFLLEDEELNTYLETFYSYFESGHLFEEFLKEYLIKMGLDEVELTQRARDGGIDLTATRKGVGDFSENDITHYYIQAKCYAPNRSISVKDIRELKGTMPFGYKGMFITTAKFSRDAEEAAQNDISKLVVLVDGKKLLMSCIDHAIGFGYKPIFNAEKMHNFCQRPTMIIPESTVSETSSDIPYTLQLVQVEKIVTLNDIRARILSIPSSIMKQIPELTTANILVNSTDSYTFSINKSRKFFSGVTTFFRKYNFLSDDGIITPKQLTWVYDTNIETIKITING